MSPGSAKSIVVALSGHIHPFLCMFLFALGGWLGWREVTL